MTERMTFADGKYTVINDNGSLTALRHGEPWGRDLAGDNLVYWMLVEALELKRQRDKLIEACLKVDKAFADAGDWPETSRELDDLHEAISDMRLTLPETKEAK